MAKMKDICHVIVAACILHNLCIDAGEPDFDWQNQPTEVVEQLAAETTWNANSREVYLAGRRTRDILNTWWVENRRR